MILVDTSIWVDHFSRPDQEFQLLLDARDVATHPLVIEELACGNLPRRAKTLSLLGELPMVLPVSHREILDFIALESLHGTGLGAVDIHLLASARLAGFPLWTRDKALHATAVRLHLA
jgi:predicted nucleic acid-binding protein